MFDLAGNTAENLRKIRENKPLIHNITNFVVMNYTANVLLAMGASPVMAHAENEVEEMVAFAGSLVLNIGTLTDQWVDAMVLAGKKATALGQTDCSRSGGLWGHRHADRRRQKNPCRNQGQCRARQCLGDPFPWLTGKAGGKGVDALHAVDDAGAVAKQLARDLRTTVAITGPVDLVTDGARVVRIEGGHNLMPVVTGTGCSATATIGAFLAVDPDASLGGRHRSGLFRYCRRAGRSSLHPVPAPL